MEILVLQWLMGNGPKALIHNATPDADDGPKLADEISKADPWAMIDKIKSAKTATAALSVDTNNEAGAVALNYLELSIDFY